jgi:uncharacterized protein YheU (UPF0270 family)
VEDQQSVVPEQGIEIPLDRIDPETFRNMLAEFVTREWSEQADAGFTLDDKVQQVLQQLKDKQARVVYDLASQTWNIAPVAA